MSNYYFYLIPNISKTKKIPLSKKIHEKITNQKLKKKTVDPRPKKMARHSHNVTQRHPAKVVRQRKKMHQPK